MSSKNFYGLTGDVTVDGGILNVGNAQLYANTETSNVGIGTTNAEFKLDVHGDANVQNLYATYLHGDGSNIENIVSSQWEGSPGDPIYYTSNVGIANTSPVTKTLQVGSNLYVEDAGSNVIHVTGNVYADYFVGDGSQLTGIAASLDQIVDQGNTVSNTIQLVSGQDATSNVGLVTHEGVSISVSNANPTGEYQFGVGSNLLVNVYSSNVLTVGGNVFAQKMTLGSVTVTPAYNLQQITETGPTTNQTLVLSNVTTGLTADANVVVNGNVTAGSVITSGNVNAGNVVTSSNIEVGGDLSVTGNVYIDDMRVAEVASNLVTYDSTTGELMDSGGLFSNKLAVVSEQPPIALTGASTLVTNHGTYTIEASSGTVVNLFDKNDSTKWVTDGNYSTTVDTKGTYGGSASLAGHGGEWVKITMPYKTILRHIKIESTNQSVEDIELVGLNADGLTWTPLKTETGLTGPTHTIIVNATTHHRTYGLIVVKTNTTTGRSAVEIEDLKLFTESFSIDGGKVEMATSAVMGGETTMDQHGPHSRDPTTPLLKKFPEIVFDASKYDQNHSTNTYVQAGYTVTASSQATDAKIAAKLYNDQFPININTDDGWQSQINTYNGSTGVATSLNTLTGITGATSSRNGSYTTLELPHKIKLSYLQIHTRNSVDHNVPAHPKEVYVYGSNDGSSWTQVGSHLFTSVPSSPIWQRIDINSTTPYKYFVLQTTSILPYTDENGNPTSLNRVYILDLEWYGYEEDPPAGDTSVDTTFTSIMNTPQTGGVKVYVDGNTLDNKVSGPDATGPSATYDSTGKYWELTGSLESNIAVEANTFLSGDAPHSVSMWFNSSNLEANVSNTCVFSISDQEKLDSVNLDLQSNTWHNLTYAYQGEGGSRVTYLDGRKVAEDQAEDTFGDYPPFAMTGYSQGGYVVSASDEEPNYNAWKAFENLNTNTDAWSTDFLENRYDVSSGEATANAPLFEGERGDWIQIQLPYKFKLDYILIDPRRVASPKTPEASPGDGRIFGSIDGTNWTLITSFSGRLYGGMTSNENATAEIVTTPTDTCYNYYRLQVTKRAGQYGTDKYVAIGQLKLYGHRENDLVRLPDPTRVLKYPHIAMTGPAQRGYVATVSSILSSSYNAFSPFNGDSGVGNTLWISESGGDHTYTSGLGNGQYTGEVKTVSVPVSGTGTEELGGEYVELELPHKIKLTDVGFQREYYQPNDIYGPSRMPAEGSISASNDKSTWYTIHSWTGLVPGDVSHTGDGYVKTLNGGTNFGIINTSSPNYGAYKYYRFIWERLYRVDIVGADNPGIAGCDEIEFYGTGVDSIPIQIGGGNIDKVANFRVYDKFVGEDQALEIWDAQKDAFGRAKSSMTLQKGRLGIGTTEPEGRLAVVDEPNGLEEFPPRAMTGEETHFEGHGTFKVALSSADNGNGVIPAFNKKATLSDPGDIDYIEWGTSQYTSATGVYTGSVSTQGVYGEWIEIQMPYKIKLEYNLLYHRNRDGTITNDYWVLERMPRDGAILGSNDGENWTTLQSWTDFEWVTGTSAAGQRQSEYWLTPGKFVTNSTAYYKTFRLVFSKLFGANGDRVNLAEWRLFGTREQGQSVLHDGQLTLTKNLNVPRIGPALDADDTPRRDRLVVEYNTSTNPTFEGAVRDTSGRGNDGVFYGTNMNYSSTEKAFEFNGTDDYVSVKASGVKGSSLNTSYSFSIWIKMTNTASAAVFITVGTSASGEMIGLRMANGTTQYFVYHFNGDSASTPTTYGVSQEWRHVALTWDNSHQRIYIDGVLAVEEIASSSFLDIPDNPNINLGMRPDGGGSTEYFKGYQSNPKIYECTLTAEEVKTLYNMGRTGSVANPQPLHIAAPMQVEKTLRIPVDNTDTGVYTAGMIRFNKDLGKIQVHNGSMWLTIGGVSATGGVVSYADGYTIHTFTGISGTFNVLSGGDMEYLVVAGGGGGGYDGGGGGGAGGMLTGTLTAVTPDSYTITRGGGGAAATEVGSKGGNGSNSTAFNLTALGGGGGGSKSASGNSGGSGGGGGHPSTAGGQGQPGQGSNGGSSSTTGGGGGGGAGGVGGNSVINTSSGNGGVGLQSGISGTNTYYAGGGGGGSYSHGGGSGGNGGGGGGGDNIENASQSGTPNTGGGGGADGIASGPGASAGGSGIVIIRYLS
jgi:hypothetical protein